MNKPRHEDSQNVGDKSLQAQWNNKKSVFKALDLDKKSDKDIEKDRNKYLKVSMNNENKESKSLLFNNIA